MADGTPEAPSTPAREGGPCWTGLGPGQCCLLAQQLPKTENLPILSAQPHYFLLQEDLLATPKGRNLFVLQAWAFLSWSHLDLPLSTLPGVFPSTWGRMASDAAPRHSAHSQGPSQTKSTGRGAGEDIWHRGEREGPGVSPTGLVLARFLTLVPWPILPPRSLGDVQDLHVQNIQEVASPRQSSSYSRDKGSALGG